MSTLLLKLRGPLQSWAVQSRYRSREAGIAPSKSGVLGLLAAAQGRRRTEPLEDLVDLSYGVRADQPGNLVRDYQSAYIAHWPKNKNTQITNRYYLSDAAFLTAVSGDDALIEDLQRAVRSPRFPLFLGRRSCPANPDLLIGIRDGDLREVLCSEPWLASDWYRREQPRKLSLALYRDAEPGEPGDDLQDVPISFSPEHRQYAWRRVVAESVRIENPVGRHRTADPYIEAVMTP